MTNTGRRYPPEFRQRLIELVRGGQRPEELSREFEPSAQAIRNWVARADRGEKQAIQPTAERERELVEAKEEIRRLREERAILREMLKVAAAWFARERPADSEDDDPLPWRIPE